ncbi:alpha/beta hydrolase [Cellvibrio mixtus]|uniref:alpha/beta hydrolase n=1 Tax=Cellvibrio mixtus TaxID=39650 RepID=UPI0006938C43|nr:alpha/beta hydrolase-fold protein [Cellvibrio mixtus]
MSNETLFYPVHILLLLLVLTGCGGNGAGGSRVMTTTHSSSSAMSTSLSSSSRDLASSDIRYHRVASKVLGKNMGLAIYLPPGYNPVHRYPVLYIMYGYGGSEYSMFNNFMSVNRTADRMIAKGSMQPTILVVPDYDNSFAVNSTAAQNPDSDGGTIGLYEDYLIKEIIPYVDRNFSTDNDRTARFIEGYSMGGFATLYLGFNYPELFSKIGAHSSALWDYSSSDMFIGQRDWLYSNAELRARRDPFLLAQSQDLRNIDIYLDVGTRDPLLGVNQRFYQHLLKQGIRVQWHNNAGAHSAVYWNENTENYFRFY